ncbi:hypothetical protein ADUPG1_012903 [Aduncisulcus paluster]|uniref:Uncharacterized protein n=1 Tax=Aduncisulcus paluster TaxID=2918883 RepID=A0ABQ5K145_9EUKA|nr:hypothetical protein ADUPG1_012903 [Aduncisulcus paluster]
MSANLEESPKSRMVPTKESKKSNHIYEYEYEYEYGSQFEGDDIKSYQKELKGKLRDSTGSLRYLPICGNSFSVEGNGKTKEVENNDVPADSKRNNASVLTNSISSRNNRYPSLMHSAVIDHFKISSNFRVLWIDVVRGFLIFILLLGYVFPPSSLMELFSNHGRFANSNTFFYLLFGQSGASLDHTSPESTGKSFWTTSWAGGWTFYEIGFVMLIFLSGMSIKISFTKRLLRELSVRSFPIITILNYLIRVILLLSLDWIGESFAYYNISHFLDARAYYSNGVETTNIAMPFWGVGSTAAVANIVSILVFGCLSAFPPLLLVLFGLLCMLTYHLLMIANTGVLCGLDFLPSWGGLFQSMFMYSGVCIVGGGIVELILGRERVNGEVSIKFTSFLQPKESIWSIGERKRIDRKKILGELEMMGNSIRTLDTNQDVLAQVNSYDAKNQTPKLQKTFQSVLSHGVIHNVVGGEMCQNSREGPTGYVDKKISGGRDVKLEDSNQSLRVNLLQNTGDFLHSQITDRSVDDNGELDNILSFPSISCFRIFSKFNMCSTIDGFVAIFGLACVIFGIIISFLPGFEIIFKFATFSFCLIACGLSMMFVAVGYRLCLKMDGNNSGIWDIFKSIGQNAMLMAYMATSVDGTVLIFSGNTYNMKTAYDYIFGYGLFTLPIYIIIAVALNSRGILIPTNVGAIFHWCWAIINGVAAPHFMEERVYWV